LTVASARGEPATRAGATAGPAPLAWVALLAMAVHVLSFRGSGPIDDEYIFWRYARNWVAGEGLGFNPGQVVEGFSAPLWLLWIAGGLKLGLPPEMTGFAGSLGGALLAVLGASLAWSAARPGARWSPPAFLLALSPALAWHAVAGLGTAPLAGLLSLWLGAWLTSRRAGHPPWVAATALGLAGLMRVEALIFALPFLLEEWRRRRAPALLAFVPALAWVAFRLATFGRWVPVTYLVKRLPLLADLRFGAVYLALATATTGIGVLALVSVSHFARGARADPPELRGPLRAAAAGLLAHLVYVVYVGGDFMELARFFVPALPVALVLACLGFERLTARRPLRWAAFAFLALASQTPQFRERPALAARHAQFEQRWLRIGAELRRRVPADTSVALSPIGAFGWSSGLEIVDLLGLTNDDLWRVPPDLGIVDKGHHRHDADWTLAQEPDLVILANAWMSPAPAEGGEAGAPTLVISAWERDLWLHPRFQAEYATLALDLPDDQPLIFHLRRGSPVPLGARPL